MRILINAAKEDASSPRYVRGVIGTILEHGDKVTYEQIADYLDITTKSHVGSAVKALKKYGVVNKSKRGREAVVDFNRSNIDELRRAAERREHSEELLGSV